MMGKERVDHPDHYNAGGVECIDALASATADLTGIEAFDTANAIKYLWRWKHKNGVEDLKKAKWYIDHLIELKSPAKTEESSPKGEKPPINLDELMVSEKPLYDEIDTIISRGSCISGGKKLYVRRVEMDGEDLNIGFSDNAESPKVSSTITVRGWKNRDYDPVKVKEELHEAMGEFISDILEDLFGGVGNEDN